MEPFSFLVLLTMGIVIWVIARPLGVFRNWGRTWKFDYNGRRVRLNGRWAKSLTQSMANDEWARIAGFTHTVAIGLTENERVLVRTTLATIFARWLRTPDGHAWANANWRAYDSE